MTNNSSRRHFLAAGLALPAGVSPVKSLLQAPREPKIELRYNTLGRTGLKVTTVGFGCMVTSDSSVIERAADLGINYFDTARVYRRGNNERMLGAALKSRRKNVIISTKTLTYNKQAALNDLDASLQTIGTDYLDIWHLHDKKSAAEVADDLLEAQQIAKKAGKIRFAGLSVHNGHKEVIPAAIKSGQIDVLLTTYNFAIDKSIEPLIESAHAAGLGVIAMKVMAGSFRVDQSYDQAREALRRPGAALAALKWVLKNPNIDAAIPSMTDMEQLEENITAMSARFTESDRKVLSAQLDYIRPLYCRMCGECEGACPKGLPVADILRYLTYAEGYGQFPLGREHFLALPPEVTAVRCDECPTCSVQCPFGVKVAARLSRAQELFA